MYMSCIYKNGTVGKIVVFSESIILHQLFMYLQKIGSILGDEPKSLSTVNQLGNSIIQFH